MDRRDADEIAAGDRRLDGRHHALRDLLRAVAGRVHDRVDRAGTPPSRSNVNVTVRTPSLIWNVPPSVMCQASGTWIVDSGSRDKDNGRAPERST